MKRKVLHILGSLNVGGAENLVLDLARYCTLTPDAQIDCHIVYMHDSMPERVALFREVLGDRLQLIPCGKGMCSTLKFISSLRKYIVACSIDVIHCHNNVDAYWAYIASLFTGVGRRILSVHGFNLDFRFLAKKMAGFAYPERAILRKYSIKYVSGVTKGFYLSEYGWGELDGDIVYNGIDWNKFRRGSECNVGGEVWLRDGRPVFAMVGSFNPTIRVQKLLCEALASIGAPLPFVFLFIGGKIGQYAGVYDECVQICSQAGLLEKDVFFLGKRGDVPAILHRIQGYVYASHGDTFGISVVEAAGCGLPLLCSDIPTFREVLHDGRFGFPVSNSREAFAKEMLSLCEKVSVAPSDDDAPVCREDTPIAREVRRIYSVEECFKNYYGKKL